VTDRMLIIADDLTGAADSGLACALHGVRTLILLNSSDESIEGWKELESNGVLSFDANTRGLSSGHASVVVHELIRRFDKNSSALLFKKVDSTLRGNVAAEIAAALRVRRALGSPRNKIVALLAPAFPAYGRITIQGRLLLQERFLERADMWQQEAFSPRSDIAEILCGAGLTSGTIDLSILRSEERALQDAMLRLINEVDVIICDAETDEDLRAIAVASMVLDRRSVWAGSAGLAAHIPPAAGIPRQMGKTTLPSFDAGPTLFLVGSFAPISQEQARQLAMSSSVFSLIIPYQLMLDDQGSESRQELSCAIANHLERCDDVLLALDSADRCSNDQGLRLTRSLAQTIKPFAATIGALVATGGETARAIMDEWNIQRLEVLGEVETGVALSRPVNWSRNIPVITKAGGFGTPETLVHCRRFLQDLKRVNPSHI
jgi:uncharacterized protein YgbK (DUF1537 family)